MPRLNYPVANNNFIIRHSHFMGFLFFFYWIRCRRKILSLVYLSPPDQMMRYFSGGDLSRATQGMFRVKITTHSTIISKRKRVITEIKRTKLMSN